MSCSLLILVLIDSLVDWKKNLHCATSQILVTDQRKKINFSWKDFSFIKNQFVIKLETKFYNFFGKFVSFKNYLFSLKNWKNQRAIRLGLKLIFKKPVRNWNPNPNFKNQSTSSNSNFLKSTFKKHPYFFGLNY